MVCCWSSEKADGGSDKAVEWSERFVK